MSVQYYSVEQVAELLGLHVRTVRGYVRDGRLKATRIGKQYRIARQDLEALTGAAPAAGQGREHPGDRRRHAEATTVVQIDAVDHATATRVFNTLMAATAGRPQDGGQLRIETVRDEERESLKIVILGGLADTAEILRLVDALVGDAE
ncbi:helix-turn-helix domain-containing protein [Kitasatospora sp. NPDC004240]